MNKPIWWSVFLCQGADHLEVDGQGDVVLQTVAGMVRMAGPHGSRECERGRS